VIRHFFACGGLLVGDSEEELSGGVERSSSESTVV